MRFLALFLLAAAVASAKDPFEKADALLASFIGDFAAFRTNFVKSNGRPFQGLPTHSVVPLGGLDITPNNKTAKPTDQEHDWTEFAKLPAKLPFVLTCNTIGRSWIIHIEVETEGTNFARVVERATDGKLVSSDWMCVATNK